ncbi:MAG: hypothetical protein RBT76_04430 [candidate division Zixibacteria bacterium]|nr:hypothetical protein [candidate division Zixibacteria bacterium]
MRPAFRFVPTAIYSAVLLLCSTATVFSQVPRVVVSVGDTSFVAGSRNNYLSLRLYNFEDSIAGVGLQLKSERPDLVTFNFSGVAFDTVGTLVSGWEYCVVVDSLSNGVFWRLAAAADFFPDQNRPPAIPPQSGGIVVRVPLNTPPNPDTSLPLIAPITMFGRQEFSTTGGQLIGVVTDTIVDTSYLACQNWLGDSCTLWFEVDPSISPYDSIAYDSSLVGQIDTTVVVSIGGSVSLIPTLQCDITADNSVDLSDLICLVNFLFLGQTSGGCVYFGYCDPDSSGGTDLSDLIQLVNYLFLGGNQLTH